MVTTHRLRGRGPHREVLGIFRSEGIGLGCTRQSSRIAGAVLAPGTCGAGRPCMPWARRRTCRSSNDVRQYVGKCRGWSGIRSSHVMRFHLQSHSPANQLCGLVYSTQQQCTLGLAAQHRGSAIDCRRKTEINFHVLCRYSKQSTHPRHALE